MYVIYDRFVGTLYRDSLAISKGGGYVRRTISKCHRSNEKVEMNTKTIKPCLSKSRGTPGKMEWSTEAHTSDSLCASFVIF
jgi:hypothetical protein